MSGLDGSAITWSWYHTFLLTFSSEEIQEKQISLQILQQSFVGWLETILLPYLSTHLVSFLYKNSSLWLSPVHPLLLFKIFPMILSFLQHWFLPVRTLPSIFTFFHSCYLLPSLITSTSFCAYLFLPLISPPGNIRCTLLSFNSTFCSPLKK